MLKRNCVLVSVLSVLLTSPAWALQFTSLPVLTMDPNGTTPLAGVVQLATDVPSMVSLRISNGLTTLTTHAPTLQTDHAVPVLGLRPGHTYTVEVTVTDAAAVSIVSFPLLQAVTPLLPADFPQIGVFYSDPAQMEPGLILMDLLRRFGPGPEYSIITDSTGEVVWYSTVGSDSMTQLPNGNLLLLNSSELTMTGDLVVPRTLQDPGVTLHHDLVSTPHNTWLSLSLEQVVVNNYPTSTTDPTAPTQTTDIAADTIVEFADDGSLLNSWRLVDILSPTRIGYMSLDTFFFLPNAFDWSHANGLAYDPTDDSILVSVRHQDAVIKFSRATGQLIWILGPHDNWPAAFQPFLLNPVGPLQWQFAQHAPEITPTGTVLLFDNGNFRASPFDGMTPIPDDANQSRAVEYSIDEVNMEVSQVWEYGPGAQWPQYSRAMGDVDVMPITGNVVTTFSVVNFLGGLPSTDWGLGSAHTAIIETDHSTPAQKVFEMRVFDPAGTIAVYRSERIPGLYPSDVSVVSDPTPLPPVAITLGPALTLDPNGTTPLAAHVQLKTNVPSRISLHVSDGTESFDVDFTDFQEAHKVPVLGLKPDRSYTVTVTAHDQLQRTSMSAGLGATTAPLPADFPQIDVFYSDPARAEPGYVLMDRFRRFGPGVVYSIITDLTGEVVWYSTLGDDTMRQLPNGNLLLLDSSELRMTGKVIVPRTLEDPGVALHHDLVPTPHNTWLSLSLESVVVNNYPTSTTDPNAPTQATAIASDMIVEFADDGSLLNTWRLSDILDPTRIGYMSLDTFFFLPNALDWSHANGLAYDPTDDSILVSVRHQDAVIKFSRATGQLTWILGPHDNWPAVFQPFLLNPVGPLQWQFAQHAPEITPTGTVLLFDNGNFRASPFDGMTPVPDDSNFSRAVEFSIDEANMEVSQVWEYGPSAQWPQYSGAMGDVDLMPTTGNVVTTFSVVDFLGGLPSSDWGLGSSHTAIVETDHATPPRKIFEMRIHDPAAGGSMAVYRSERIPSLYPSNVTVR